MSLRIKTLIIIGVTLVSLIILLYTVSRIIVLNSFAQLEERSVHQNVQRVLNAVSDELSNMDAVTIDWAQWDETYAFAQDANSQYMTVNLNNSSFANINMNVVVIFNASGQKVGSKALDLQTKQEVPFPKELDDQLSSQSLLLKHPDEESHSSGLILIPEGPLLVTSRPILTNDGKGPIRGTFIFGRYLNEAKVQQLSNSLRLPLTVYRIDDPKLPSDFQTARPLLTQSESILIQPLNTDSMDGYTQLEDVSGKPALLLRTDMPRDIYKQGEISISYFVVSLLVAGLVFGGVILLLLERVVLAPVAALSKNVSAITARGDIAARLLVTGRDELAFLGSSINKMLAALEQAQKNSTESDQRLRAVINNAPLVIWALDDKGKLILLDGNGLKVLGIEAQKLIGQPLAELSSGLPQLGQESRRALDGETVMSEITIADLKFEAHFMPMRDCNGAVTGLIGVATDITQRARAEAALEQARSHLEQRNQQLERAYEIFHATSDHLIETVGRGASKTELLQYLEMVRLEFNRLN